MSLAIRSGIWVSACGVVIVLTACGSNPATRSGECSQASFAAPSTSRVDCPIFAGCAAMFADQVAMANADAGVCGGQFADTVLTATCGAHQIWRQSSHYGFWDCIYTAAGALVGSAQCGDTGCLRGGDVVDVAAICPDAAFGPNLCPADAGAD